jgi:hypothetical protein
VGVHHIDAFFCKLQVMLVDIPVDECCAVEQGGLLATFLSQGLNSA